MTDPAGPAPEAQKVEYVLQHRKENGRCVSWCYACERIGLQERVKFTADYESLKGKLQSASSLTSDVLVAELRAQLAAEVARREQLASDYAALAPIAIELREQLNVAEASREQAERERGKWLDSFNRSEQFQDGWMKRAEAAESRLAALQSALEGLEQEMRTHVGIGWYEHQQVQKWADRLAALRTQEGR